MQALPRFTTFSHHFNAIQPIARTIDGIAVRRKRAMRAPAVRVAAREARHPSCALDTGEHEESLARHEGHPSCAPSLEKHEPHAAMHEPGRSRPRPIENGRCRASRQEADDDSSSAPSLPKAVAAAARAQNACLRTPAAIAAVPSRSAQKNVFPENVARRLSIVDEGASGTLHGAPAPPISRTLAGSS